MRKEMGNGLGLMEANGQTGSHTRHLMSMVMVNNAFTPIVVCGIAIVIFGIAILVTII